jgi:hypothetical protein
MTLYSVNGLLLQRRMKFQNQTHKQNDSFSVYLCSFCFIARCWLHFWLYVLLSNRDSETPFEWRDWNNSKKYHLLLLVFMNIFELIFSSLQVNLTAGQVDTLSQQATRHVSRTAPHTSFHVLNCVTLKHNRSLQFSLAPKAAKRRHTSGVAQYHM